MMTRIFALAIIVSALLMPVSGLAADGLAYEDNKLNFIDCEGQKLTARWFGSDLSLSRAGIAPADPAKTVSYRGWDGSCHKVTWDDAKATFDIVDGKGSRAATALRYIAWDNGKWVATRTGLGFYISRIAAAATEPSASDYSSAAKWLGRTDPSNFGAVALAEYLSAAAKKARGVN